MIITTNIIVDNVIHDLSNNEHQASYKGTILTYC